MPIELQTAPAATPVTGSTDAVPVHRRPLLGPAPPGARERMAFTEQLALLLSTGMPLHLALQSVRQQASNPAMRDIIDDLVAEVEKGQRFASALARHPTLFSSTFVNLVSASEGSGFLPKVLEQLVAEEEKRDELRNTLVSALTYPAFLIGFSLLVVVFVLVVVFPKFGVMFARIYDQLPVTTKALMACSDFLTLYWWQLLLVLGGCGVLIVRWLKADAGQLMLDSWKLKIPGLRNIFVQLYITQSMRVLSLSLAHGVSIVDALDATRDVVSNRLYRAILLKVELSVQEGGTIAAAFTDSKLIPDLVKQMVATAEASGNLAPVMARIAEHYERELSRRLVALSKMAEPVMLLIMGVIVGVIVSSLILPIFKLSKAVT